MDVASLRRYALEEVRRFEQAASANGIRNEIVLAARYVLCAGLDEAVLSTPSGAQSEWSQHPLLVALHREAWGGEKFFEMLDRISADPGRHLDLLELQYLILALGFTGKYQMLDRGHEQLADLQAKVYRTIREQRGGATTDLSLRWRGLEDQRNRLIRYVPWWVVVSAALAVLAMTFAVYYSWLATQADPLHARLAQIGIEDFAVPPAPTPVPVKGPTLKQLLAPEEAAGLLTVTEDGGRSIVTIRGSDLFRSGSTEINQSLQGTLDRIAAAMNEVPGRVMVVGHTDDQPIQIADAIATTTSCRASAPSALPTYCSGRFAYLRGSRGGESARHSPSHPGPIRRVGRAIAGSKSFTSAKANRRRRG